MFIPTTLKQTNSQIKGKGNDGIHHTLNSKKTCDPGDTIQIKSNQKLKRPRGQILRANDNEQNIDLLPT